MSSPTTPGESRLAAVPDPASGAPPGTDPSDEAPEGVSRKLFLLLAGLLVLALLALAVQSRRVEGFERQTLDLQEQVSGLSGELRSARQRMAAYEQERAQVRASVGRLREDLAALEALLTPGRPVAAPPAGESRPEAP